MGQKIVMGQQRYVTKMHVHGLHNIHVTIIIIIIIIIIVIALQLAAEGLLQGVTA